MVKSDKPKTKLPPKPKAEKKKSSESESKPAKQPKQPKPAKEPKVPKEPKAPKTPKPKPTENTKKKEKPEKDFIKKPGQKYPEPSIDDPSRAFYESLYSQKPESQMAEKWCLEHGLLSEEESKKLAEKYKRKK